MAKSSGHLLVICEGSSQMVLVVKNMPVSTGDERDLSLILGSEDPLEEGMATHWSCLEWVAWRTPWIEEPGWQATIHGHHKESRDPCRPWRGSLGPEHKAR